MISKKRRKFADAMADAFGSAIGRTVPESLFSIGQTYANEKIKYHFYDKRHHQTMNFDEMEEEVHATLDRLMYPREGLFNQSDELEALEAGQKVNISWEEYFAYCNEMPTLPPFLAKILKGCPVGYKPAIMLLLLSALGAICFSKIRAVFSDGRPHAPNLMNITEGSWGCGKGKLEQTYYALFSRIIERDRKALNDVNRENHIIQTAGINISESALYDMLRYNQGCHFFIFEPEVKTVVDVLKKPNALKTEHLRMAFDNSEVYQQNKTKTNRFQIYMNVAFTGVPNDVQKLFSKELSGGTVSRFAFSVIPEEGREIAKLNLPTGQDLENLRDEIDNWCNAFSFHTDQNGKDIAHNETGIDLDYINKALDEWLDGQYDLYEEEDNSARRDARKRLAAMAFHAAIVIAMLWGNPGSQEKPKREKVVNLTLYLANYFMERYLHKFGEKQNQQRQADRDAENVIDKIKAGFEKVKSNDGVPMKDTVNVAEMKKLHDEGRGWDKVGEMFGMSGTYAKRLIQEYEESIVDVEAESGEG